MTTLIVSIIVIYVAVVIFYANKIANRIEFDYDNQEETVREAHQVLLNKKDLIASKKAKLENEALEIFTLYEITKNITKSLSEDNAFDIFKKQLAQHVVFEECRHLDSSSNEIEELRKLKDYFVFTLKGKKRKMGYLAIKGVKESDKEKVMILGHQFALALRRVKLYAEIEKTAITDGLTDVYTRRYIMERFEEEIERSRLRNIQLSFLMIDVDFFKNFNDTYGHLMGDQILREIASIVKANIREIDIAGRYGGEEFCIILPDTDSKGAQFAAERIRVAAEQTNIQAYDASVKATLSVGISTFPKDGKSSTELIDKADWALYRAKNNGRNQICSFGVYGKK